MKWGIDSDTLCPREGGTYRLLFCCIHSRIYLRSLIMVLLCLTAPISPHLKHSSPRPCHHLLLCYRYRCRCSLSTSTMTPYCDRDPLTYHPHTALSCIVVITFSRVLQLIISRRLCLCRHISLELALYSCIVGGLAFICRSTLSPLSSYRYLCCSLSTCLLAMHKVGGVLSHRVNGL